MTRTVTVVCVGNEGMGDDAVGMRVARGLEARAPAVPAEVVDGGMRGMGLLKYFRDSDVVIYVDAIDTEAEPGAIFRFHPDEAGVTRLRSHNIHGMGVGYLLTNARLLGRDPDVIVYAVQVGDVRPSDDLTPEVERAAAEVERMVLDDLREIAEAQADVAAG